MREILFRGKRIDNGEWVKGFYVCDPQEDYEHQIYTVHTHPCGCHLIPYSINCETIGQYIGLNDRNDNKIFEGDIVIIEYSTTEVKGHIKYQGSAYYVATDFDLWDIDEYFSIQIIGNIHDNPELLGGEQG